MCCPWFSKKFENEEFITNVDFVRESFEEERSKLDLEISRLKEMEIGPNGDEDVLRNELYVWFED